MPETSIYNLYIKNASSFISADGNSEVALTGTSDLLPASLAVPAEANGWLKVPVLGLSPEMLQEGSTYTSPSGNEYSDFLGKRKFTVKTFEYIFPDEFEEWDLIGQVLAGNNVVIASLDYPIAIHSEDMGIAVTCKSTPEHDYEKGRKSWTLEFRKRGFGA